jgi:quercetin dioxygenase-like cupin family protein
MTVVRASARATRRGAIGHAPSRMRATVVSFTPGARTGWHSHPVGQTLYCLSGVGRICIGKGSRPQAIYPGDTVMIPPDAMHWHGAAPDRLFAHLAMSENGDKARARPGLSTSATAITRWNLPPPDEAVQPRVPAARSAAISAGSSQPARAASASSPRLGGWGGIGRSGTVRLKRGAGAGCTIPSIST